MFPELNMTGHMKAMSYGIKAVKFLLGYTIAKEVTKMSTGALSVHDEEERQNKHNQKLEEMSSQGFNHRGAQRVISCVWSMNEYD